MTWKRCDNWPNRLYSSVPRSSECIAQVVNNNSRPILVLMIGGRFCLIMPLMVPSGSCTWRDCACGIIGAHGLLW